MVVIKDIIKRLKQKTNIETNKALSKSMGVNPNQVNVWLNKNSINYHVVIDYCDRNDISLDWLFLDKKYEIDDDIIVLVKTILNSYSKKELMNCLNKLIKNNSDNIYDNEFLVDHVAVSLKRFKESGRSLFLKYFSKTNLQKEIETLLKHDKPLIDNSKDLLVELITNSSLNKFMDTETKRFKIVNEIKNDFSQFECYILIKYSYIFKDIQ